MCLPKVIFFSQNIIEISLKILLWHIRTFIIYTLWTLYKTDITFIVIITCYCNKLFYLIIIFNLESLYHVVKLFDESLSNSFEEERCKASNFATSRSSISSVSKVRGGKTFSRPKAPVVDWETTMGAARDMAQHSGALGRRPSSPSAVS